MNNLIENHKMIGKSIEYKDSKGKESKGIVTGAKLGIGILMDVATGESFGRPIMFRIKPNDGSRAFWTGGMRNVD